MDINRSAKIFCWGLWNAKSEMGIHVIVTAFQWYIMKFPMLTITGTI